MIKRTEIYVRLRSIWKSMIYRCADRSNKYYGAKGIKVCQEWLDFRSFYCWAVLHGYQDGLTIDRKNGNRNYSPENCCWTNGFGQAKTKDRCRKLLWNGQVYSTGELAEKVGIRRDTINNRLRLGWSLKKAVMTPELRK